MAEADVSDRFGAGAHGPGQFGPVGRLTRPTRVLGLAEGSWVTTGR